ncbi:MAG: Fe-S cluster assembly protein SufD [Rubricoccaceae bacterium]|nr:Fe-S cluster assembly protein SufD [Rubricoccaceae bacterium]
MLTLNDKPGLYTTALEEMDRVFSGDGAPRPFADLRKRGREVFEAQGVPSKKNESWKYTDVSKVLPDETAFAGSEEVQLSTDDLASYAIPDLDARTIVTVNGVFQPSLSDLTDLGRVVITSLREAVVSHPKAMEAHFGRYADVDSDSFVALNSAFDLDGVFLHVPDGVVVERPVRILHLIDTSAASVIQSRHLLVFGTNSHAKIVETHQSARSDTDTFGNHVTEIVAGADSVVDHYRIQDEGDLASQVNATHVYQRDRSVFSTATFTFASTLVRNNLNIVADGEGCESNLGGLYILEGAQHVDNHTLVDHAKPGCNSNELYKGIIYDRATGVFNGKVMVRRDAQQTNAYQQSQGVVLSDDARHFSKPELEIYADDVKCSHGSTTGEIDPEALFYCRARGISFEDARALLLYAFAHDVVEEVKIESLREWLDARIDQRLK